VNISGAVVDAKLSVGGAGSVEQDIGNITAESLLNTKETVSIGTAVNASATAGGFTGKGLQRIADIKANGTIIDSDVDVKIGTAVNASAAGPGVLKSRTGTWLGGYR
jgi:hypothetical protein